MVQGSYQGGHDRYIRMIVFSGDRRIPLCCYLSSARNAWKSVAPSSPLSCRIIKEIWPRLPRHALERPEGNWRIRAAPLCTRCLEGRLRFIVIANPPAIALPSTMTLILRRAPATDSSDGNLLIVDDNV